MDSNHPMPDNDESAKVRKSLKDLLLSMPQDGEDSDFDRTDDRDQERGPDCLNPFSD